LVTFSISDKFGPINPNSLNRLLFNLSGPNEDFSFYEQESVVGNAKQVAGTNNWTYQFSAKIPKDAEGSYSLGVEGRRPVMIDVGEDADISHNDQMQNFIHAFAVTDAAPVARRLVVDDAKCENCHSNLSLHGSNRHDANGYCDTCHMPGATDAVVRPEVDNPPEGIHFKYMIHKIHRGERLQNGFVVYGYRGSVHDYGHVAYPGNLKNCDSCHADTGSDDPEDWTWTLPLPADVLPTLSPATAINPIMLPQTATCLSCHDSDDAAAHADANTSANLGESCGTCHNTGKTYSVERVHAR
jgi:OmcA/MtrC family decaheme c-type cytochrome